MVYSLFFGMGFNLVPLILWWIGTWIWRRTARDLAYWALWVGVLIVTFADGLNLVVGGMLIDGFGGNDWMGWNPLAGLGWLGQLIFSVGFVMRALRSAREMERVKELEMVIQAQSEQLSRQEG
ncbi:hypothetical protein HNR46_002115 [Haloferula luteola]|uniref:Uncharacterized protein n=1 Tax=Haloferula luteola TaxID=595692 RepID=A0A840V494_9BACT|nr:hypothetical protein [Haloferula luteola]MBB5351876.1 hypothetical protein [Haloferula luteola]